MNYETKLSLFLNNIQNNISKKMVLFELHFAKNIFFLFFGFLVGNLFGSLLNIFHELIIWNGFITILLIIFEEVISYLTYHSKKPTNFFKLNFFNFLGQGTSLSQHYFFNKKNFLIRSLNLFKIGILLGFFIDAFKVGS